MQTHPTLRSHLSQFVLTFVFMMAAALSGAAQSVEYDWTSTSKTPESYPQIRRTQLVTFKIKNVNDILYSYRLEVTQTPMEFDDFGLISKLIAGLPQAKAQIEGLDTEETCASAMAKAVVKLNAAIAEINGDVNLPTGYAAKKTHDHVALQTSVEAWHSHITIINDATAISEAAIKVCNGRPDNDFLTAYELFKDRVVAIDKKVNSAHVFTDTHELSPGNNVSVTVFEEFHGETISSKTFSFPGTDILTLSAGALFTTIPDRSYQARKTPDATQNVLAVEGNSRFTPGIVALLNYSLGGLGLDRDTAGLALSAGPVIRLGSQSNSSTFGFFTGISGHLYHRIYFTPGIHFGQFADFPVGFHNGSPIPANFGELTPVKRWTGRFGLAITFKTKDFSGLTQSNTPAVKSGDSTATPPKPTATPTPVPPALKVVLNAQPTIPTAVLSAMQPQPVVASPAASRANPVRADTDPTVSLVSIAAITISPISRGDRVAITTGAPVHDYSMYFRSGRFYVTIPHGRMDGIEDGLHGGLFSEVLVEMHDNSLTLSFSLVPGTRASIAESKDGLDLLFMSPPSRGGRGLITATDQ
ncbi:MAG: hypothetical protein JWM21_852 [Acidobacteria bacterium]|nr:hypothetical protein [Acidobacteriota bacterium]